MKIYSVLLLITMSALGADKRITFASIGLGTVCIAAMTYQLRSSHVAGKEFDEDLDRKAQPGVDWKNKANKMKRNGGYDDENFKSLYDEAGQLDILSTYKNQTVEDFLKHNPTVTFHEWLTGRISILDHKHDHLQRPPLFTFSTNCLGAAGLLLLIYGGYRYRSESSKG